jgi:hypothetical protein
MAKIAQLGVLLAACTVLFTVDWQNPWRKLSTRAQAIIVSLNAMAVVFQLYRLMRIVASPREWDFLSYFLWSRLVGSGLPVYSPESSRTVLSTLDLPITPSEEFVREIVNVGPTNPPTTLVWVRIWIGDLPFGVAHIVWLSINVAFLVLCCYLLARSLGANRLTTFALVFPVVAISPVTGIVLRYSQTAFVVMAAILAAWLTISRYSSAIWLALGSLIKPFAALLGLYFVLRRRWREAFIALTIGLAALSATGFLFGFDQVSSFLSGEVTARSPTWVYTEPVNQSLMAMVLRTFDPELGGGKTLSHPIFLILAAGFTLTTAALGWLTDRDREHLVFLHVLSLSLLIYPGSLSFYSFFLFLPWIHLGSIGLRNRVPTLVLAAGMWGAILSIGYSAFSASLATWGLVALMLSAPIIRTGSGPGAEPGPAKLPASQNREAEGD